MNYRHITALVFFITGLFSTQPYAALKPLDHIVVIVNEDVITNSMLKNRIADFEKQLKPEQLARISKKDLEKQVLERMIRDTIQLQQAKQFGITVDDLTLNRVLEQLAKNNNMSLEVFRETVEQEGLNYTRLREQTRNELIINQLQQRIIASKISVSDQEVEQYIAQSESLDGSSTSYHLRHILIATPETAKPEDIEKAQNKAESIYKQIQQGSDFSDLAIKESQGRNALQGGDLGERKANELPQLFVDAVKDLKVGESSKPIRSASGFHLLQLVGSSNEQQIVKQLHIRHILIRSGAGMSDDQARQTLLELKQKIESGSNFAELASEYSEDPGSNTKGGDLGWAGPGDFVPAFENVANNIPAGQISEPFKTTFGWHILEVLDTRELDQKKTNREKQARNAIQKQKADEELRLWLRRIRDEAYVEYIDN